MYGFENISANNGWAIAVLGAGIVFCGLAVLSLVISQIHRILRLFERKKTAQEAAAESGPAQRAAQAPRRLPNARELASIYRPLAEGLDSPFQLAELYETAAKMDLPHSHLSISRLREAGILVPKGEGDFVWDQEKADSLSM